MEDFANHYELRNRYLFKGTLEMQTAFHIGGGKVTLSHSDSPVVLTPEQIPFIPGSSFKGSLRSTVEKIVPSLPASTRLSSCALIERKEGSVPKSMLGSDRVCSTAIYRDIVKWRRDSKSPEEDQKTVDAIYKGICHTCRLFGSPFAAARINVNDLYMSKEQWDGVLQVRDGVAIDRDSEKAKTQLKYDFEVVPASTKFKLEITLENATPQDLQLIAIGLSEFVHGFGVIGGKRSRGLGVCKLNALEVYGLVLGGEEDGTRYTRLQDYLLKGIDAMEKMEAIKAQQFLEGQIESIFQKSTGADDHAEEIDQ